MLLELLGWQVEQCESTARIKAPFMGGHNMFGPRLRLCLRLSYAPGHADIAVLAAAPNQFTRAAQLLVKQHRVNLAFIFVLSKDKPLANQVVIEDFSPTANSALTTLP